MNEWTKEITKQLTKKQRNERTNESKLNTNDWKWLNFQISLVAEKTLDTLLASCLPHYYTNSMLYVEYSWGK